MRRLPTSVRVGGLRIGIGKVPNLTHDNGDEESGDRHHRAYGVFEPGGPAIWLDQSSGPERLKATLVHEVVHALINTARLNMLPDEEEEFVGRLSPLLLDFIRANVGAVAYLQES